MAVRPPDRPAVLERAAALDRATAQDWDVVVVGGGITGAGVALDAALRGYRVLLVERHDIAEGTSSRSSKLVHGGLRYLANGDVAMVAESVRERDRTMRSAPHLVRPLPFLVATGDLRERVLLKAGLVAYDVLTLGRGIAPHRRVDRHELGRVAPTLRVDSGGYRYWDARTDDARLTLAVALAARRAGAVVVNHTAATAVTTSPGGRVTGVEVRDELGGATGEVGARWVVAAGGAWAAEVRSLAPAGSWAPVVTPARGAHLVFDRAVLPVTQAVVFAAADGRRLFAVPWGRQVYVGTNDVPSDTLVPRVTPADVDYLLGAVDGAFRGTPGVEDAVGAWVGVRPLAGSGARTADLSRRHLVVQDPAGLVSVVGGKLTTWRQMAQDVVDDLVAADGIAVPCATVGVSLGADGTRREGDERMRVIGARAGVDPAASSALYHRHGDRAPEVLRTCLAEEDGLAPLVDGLPYLRGEVRWAVRHELACTVADVLRRRMRVAVRHRAAGGAAVAGVAAILDEELGIDRDRQVADYLTEVDAERGPVLRR